VDGWRRSVVTDRLKACFDAGDVLALFPLLKDWNTAELRALVKDVEKFHTENADALEGGYKELVFRPENFLSRSRSKALDHAATRSGMDLMAMCSEILSVAEFYLGQAKTSGGVA